MPRDVPEMTPDLLLAAYASGIFPMAESRDDPDLFWVDPRHRGVIPLGGFRLSRSLAKLVRGGRFSVSLDADFAGVLTGCAAREETWINADLAALYMALHHRGAAHSLEIREGEALVGGVFGIALGGAFFGESMFSRRRDASKLALAHLVTLLRRGGFALFDTQFLTPHLASLGGVEIPRAEYRARLHAALALPARLTGPVPQPSEVMHLRIQTS